MRKWIIGGVVVLLVLVIVAGVALVSLNGLIDRNKQNTFLPKSKKL